MILVATIKLPTNQKLFYIPSNNGYDLAYVSNTLGTAHQLNNYCKCLVVFLLKHIHK